MESNPEIMEIGEKHRNYDLGLIPAHDLNPNDGLSSDDLRLWGGPLEHVAIIRYPPGISLILQARILARQQQQYATNASAEAGPNIGIPIIPYSPNDISELGVRITPTSREDYRFYEIEVDIIRDEELNIMNKWHPYIDISSHTPILREAFGLPPKQVLRTLRLFGLLTELPFTIDIHKTLDDEEIIKCNNASQILVVYFEEDEIITVGLPISQMNGHRCVVQEDCDADPSDIEASNHPRCPWLSPDGVLPQMKAAREERLRMALPINKSQMHATEMSILSMLKSGREEWVELDLMSSLETFMLHEAMNKNTTVRHAASLLSSDQEFIVNVLTENQNFEDVPSDFSDVVFGDETVTDLRDLMEERPYASNQKRPRDKRNITATSNMEAELNKRRLENEFAELNTPYKDDDGDDYYDEDAILNYDILD